ncbi:hypothetical protein TrCOL_g6238 [Triparma columacea]|uniref:Uncharacterized protein n=1 Tax=Triparma columacea TaxID=722753 RepID=A0A9W7L571_9STRA|nr:hypothetical protein TrCOL_g6238 [Triparma columacea]
MMVPKPPPPSPFNLFTTLQPPTSLPTLSSLTLHYTPDSTYLLATTPSSLISLYNPTVPDASHPIQCYGTYQSGCPVVDLAVKKGNQEFASTGLNGPYRDCTVLIHDVTKSGFPPSSINTKALKEKDTGVGVRKLNNTKTGHTPPQGFLEVPGVACLEYAEGGDVLFTGGYDGRVLGWDLRQRNSFALEVCGGNGVADVKYWDGRIVVGRTEGDLDVYDCRYERCCLEKHVVQGRPGLSKVEILGDQGLAAAYYLDGVVRMVDVGGRGGAEVGGRVVEPAMVYEGEHKGETLSLLGASVVDSGRYLLAGNEGEGEGASVYDVKTGEGRGRVGTGKGKACWVKTAGEGKEEVAVGGYGCKGTVWRLR